MVSIFDSSAFNQSLFFPRTDGAPTPRGAEDIYVAVEPGCRVHARQYPSPQAGFSLLFFHGNGEIVSDYDGLAAYFNALGAEMTVCDYRGYGHSEGVPTLRDALTDAGTMFRFLNEQGKLKSRVCVMGRSLGSAPAIELCVRYPEITGCVIESGYADPIPLVERRGLRIDKTTPGEDAIFNNSRKIKLMKCPLLIMHGQDDCLINAREAVLNHKNAGSQHKVLDLLEGVGHNDMMMAAGNAYFGSLARFFKKIFR